MNQEGVLRSLKTIVGAMAAGAVAIGVVAVMTMPPQPEPSISQQVLPMLLPLATAALGWFLLGRPATATDNRDPEAQAVELLRARTMTAAGITQIGGILALPFGFVYHFPPLAVTIALVLSGLLTLAVAWPRQTRLDEWTRELRRLRR